MPNTYHPRQSANRFALRKTMTETERVLWRRLRQSFPDAGFRRQTVLGTYIVDFVSFKHQLVIEVDGSQHVDSATDRERDAWLTDRGFRVLRFWNHDVLHNTDAVLNDILDKLQPS
jgi:very-short-patch-repair endonuclease